MINTYLKTLWRMFKKHATRLLSIIFMVLISIGFCAGLGTATDKIKYSLNDYYAAKNVSDFIIKSTSGSFSDADVEAVSALFGGATVNTGASLDVGVEGKEKRSVRYYFLDFDNWTVNEPDVVDGRAPENEYEIYVEQSDNVIGEIALGSTVALNFYDIISGSGEKGGAELSEEEKQGLEILKRLETKEVTVCGIIQSPLTFARDGEPSYDKSNADVENNFTTSGTKDMDCLEAVYYISDKLIPVYSDIIPFMPATPVISKGDIYVALGDRRVFNNFSARYDALIDDGVEAVKNALGGDSAEILTLRKNYSFGSLVEYGNRVEALSYVLEIAFLLVTALVVLSTMTRLLEEERPQIACLKTLGYSSTGVISKYLLFALIATGIGGTGAYFVGLGLAYFIYYVFNYSFAMPPMSSTVAMVFYIISFALIVAATLAATAIAGYKMTGSHPAELLRPKPPRSGKKVLVERIPLIWNRLSFKYKSTTRNVFRYKSRFIMTVIAVALSTALVMAGLALLDLCLFHDFGTGAIMGIAVIIIIFAGLLTAIVIYTLTNINISERNREIATLMVLGYNDGEVSGYIYREIYINSVIGILFGYPLSALLIWGVFELMGFGVLAEVSWFMWLIAPFVVLLFTALVTLILRCKIVKIDMNESLKAIE